MTDGHYEKTKNLRFQWSTLHCPENSILSNFHPCLFQTCKIQQTRYTLWLRGSRKIIKSHIIKLILVTCLNRNAFATEDNHAVLILRVVHLSRCLKYCWCYLYDKKILSTTYWMVCLECLVSQRSPKW